jgi:hypothetical protein
MLGTPVALRLGLGFLVCSAAQISGAAPAMQARAEPSPEAQWGDEGMEESDETSAEPKRRGLNFRIALASGLSYQRYSWRGPDPIDSTRVLDVSDTTLAASPLRELELSLGYWLVPRLSTGVEVAGGLDFAHFDLDGTGTVIEFELLARAGLFVRLHWARRPYGIVAFGARFTDFSYESEDGPVNPTSVTGPYFAVGAGYDLDNGLSLSARVEGSTQGDRRAAAESQLLSIGASLQVGYAWH